MHTLHTKQQSAQPQPFATGVAPSQEKVHAKAQLIFDTCWRRLEGKLQGVSCYVKGPTPYIPSTLDLVQPTVPSASHQAALQNTVYQVRRLILKRAKERRGYVLLMLYMRPEDLCNVRSRNAGACSLQPYSNINQR